MKQLTRDTIICRHAFSLPGTSSLMHVVIASDVLLGFDAILRNTVLKTYKLQAFPWSNLVLFHHIGPKDNE